MLKRAVLVRENNTIEDGMCDDIKLNDLIGFFRNIKRELDIMEAF